MLKQNPPSTLIAKGCPSTECRDLTIYSDSSIHIGTYVDNIYNLSISNKTFDANSWVWVTRREKVENFFTHTN